MIAHISFSYILTISLSAYSLLAFGTKLPKRGLGYPNPFTPSDTVNAASDMLKANQTNGAASWVYNWATVPPDYLADSGLEFVPMQWNQVGIENLSATVTQIGAKNVLAFNEPDMPNQSNISPTTAATLWMQYFEPLKTTDSGIRLGAPAVSSGESGLDWLAEFMTACATCTIDFIPFHWYGMGGANFYAYLYEVHSKYPNYPLWITEFAETTPTDAAVLTFMDATLTNQSSHPLDGIDFVERYAWFAYERPQNSFDYYLLDANGNLNAAGDMYVLNAANAGAPPQPTSPQSASSSPTSSGSIASHTAPNSISETFAPITTSVPITPSTPSNGGSRALHCISMIVAVASAFSSAMLFW